MDCKLDSGAESIMHSRCCEELDKINNIAIAAASTFEYNFSQIDDVPCFIEAFFQCNAPTSGALYTGNKVWTGAEFFSGRLVEVATFSQIAISVGAGLRGGFFVEYPGGIGRGLLIRNNLDVNVSQMFISIRKLITITEKNKNVEGAQYG